jgi:hypothetical protein
VIPGTIDRVWITSEVQDTGGGSFDWRVEGLGPGGNEVASGSEWHRWRARRNVRKYIRRFTSELRAAPAPRLKRCPSCEGGCVWDGDPCDECSGHGTVPDIGPQTAPTSRAEGDPHA